MIIVLHLKIIRDKVDVQEASIDMLFYFVFVILLYSLKLFHIIASLFNTKTSNLIHQHRESTHTLILVIIEVTS